MRYLSLKFFLCLVFLGSSAAPVLAYHVETHAYLTREIVDFYNEHFPDKEITEGQAIFLVDGSRREDDIPRWMNHFYDPVHDRGLENPGLGTWEAAKLWAEDENNQNRAMYKVPATIASILSAFEQKKISAVSTETNFAWQRAIWYGANDEWEKAFFALGHVLHLIEDISVPDHTRNDAHPIGSPYENWAGQFSSNNRDKNLPSRLVGEAPIVLEDLGAFFDSLATYSNNNFYSADTIGIQSGFPLPQPDFDIRNEQGTFAAREDKVGTILLFRKIGGDSYLTTNKAAITLKDEDVNASYWSRLSTKTVEYGAGVVKLFFEEVETAKNNPEFQKQEEESFLATLVNAGRNAVGKMADAIRGSVATVRNTINEQASQIPEVVEPSREEEGAQEKDRDVQGEKEIKEEDSEEQAQREQEELARLQSQLDDIADMIDDLAVQVAKQIEAQTAQQQNDTQEKSNQETQEQTEEINVNNNTENISESENYISSGGGGGTAQQNTEQPFVQIYITEVQTRSTSSVHYEFVELYNPNDSSISLDGWYLQKKTKSSTEWSSYAPSSLFSGVTISTHGFIVVAHVSSSITGAINTTYGLADDNAVTLKDSERRIVDLVGWGGAAECEGACMENPPIGQSIHRSASEEVFIDTNSNATDFEITSCPSPGAQTKSCGEIIEEEQEIENQSPQAFLVINPETAYVSVPISFDASSSTDPDGVIVEYEWQFGDGSEATSSVATTTHLYGANGEYLVRLTVTDNENATSMATATLSVLGTSSLAMEGNVLISEVFFNAEGNDEGKEFIELYNTSSSTFDLAGWSLRYLTGDATTSASLAVLSSATSSDDRTGIEPLNFLLIGLHGYDAVNSNGADPDVRRTANLPNGGSPVTILLINSNGDEVDRLEYTSSSITKAGQSLERKAFAEGMCLAATGNGEFLGNGCNTGKVGDITVRETPYPQNSTSLSEPREAPTATGAQSTYTSSSLSFALTWDKAQDATGATTTITYSIRRFDSATSSLEIWRGSGTSLSRNVTEVGRNYVFGVQAFDRDGMASEMSTTSITVPGFWDRFSWYRDSEDGGQFVLDMQYRNYPFIPDLYWNPSNDDWKAIVFFLNTEPTPDEYLLVEDQFEPRSSEEALRLEFARCGGSTTSGKTLLLPDNEGRCDVGGIYSRGLAYRFIDENRIELFMPNTTGLELEKDDYLTIAFYSFYASGPATRLRIVATDANHYYFSDEFPTSSPPVISGELAFSRDATSSILSVSWDAAYDEDTAASLLMYEVYATSSEDKIVDSAVWQNIGNTMRFDQDVAPGEVWYFYVRTRDEFGNISNVLEGRWEHPETAPVEPQSITIE